MIEVTWKEYLGHYLRSRARYAALIVLGILMVCIGLFSGPDMIAGLPYRLQLEPAMYYAHLSLVITGILGTALSFARYSGRLPMGVMSIGISVYMIFLTNVGFNDLDDTDIRFVVRAIFTIMESVAILFSVKMIIGQYVNAIRLTVIFLLYFVRYFLYVLMDWHHGATFIEGLYDYSEFCSAMFLFIFAMIALNTGDVKYASALSRLRKNVIALEVSDASFSDTYLMREDLMKLLADGGEGWTRSADGSELVLDVRVFNYLRRNSIVFRKSISDGTVIGTYYPGDMKAHLIRNLNFPVRCVSCMGGDENTCESIRIYGDTGFFIEILVRDVHIKKYRTAREVRHTLLFWKRIANHFSRDEGTDY